MDAVLWTRVGAGLMLLAVVMGSFGAHGFKDMMSTEMRAVFETAVRYQAYHALGILAAAFAGSQLGARHAAAAAVCFALGMLFFSGSLYALALSGVKKFGAVAPIGGLLFMAGWGLLAFGPYKS